MNKILENEKIVDFKPNMNLVKGQFYRVYQPEIFRYIENRLYKGFIKIDDQHIMTNHLISINVPKIPASVIDEVLNFFRSVYNEHDSEAAVLLWYNNKQKKWYVEVPEQTVSGASVDYKRDEQESIKLQSRNFFIVGTIHSHCNMDAFHSGTDDDDEFSFDGIHITIGHINSIPELACRFIMKDNEIKLEQKDCTDWLPQVISTRVDWLSKVKKFAIKPITPVTNFNDVTNQDFDDVSNKYPNQNPWWKK